MELGKFEILEELGRGGFGIVYKARDKALNRLVAVKELHPGLTIDPTFISRFKHEAQIAANLDNPNLVPVYEFGQAEGRYYIVMGYMPGGSLKDLLKKEGRLSKERTFEILQQIGVGLAYAHKQGVIHRDLKPGNILFDAKGQARVSDLGFAKLLHSKSSASMSTSGGLVGTPAYMAPEIWRGKGAGASTDIYSLACILVEMLTAKPLFDGESTPEVMFKHFEPLQLPEDLPLEWKAVLEQGLEKKPEDRIGNVDDLISRLQQAEQWAAPTIPDLPKREDLEPQREPGQEAAKLPEIVESVKQDQVARKQAQNSQGIEESPDKPSSEDGEEHFHAADAINSGTQNKGSGFEGGKPGTPQNKTPVYIGLGMLALLAIFLVARSGIFSARPQSIAESEVIQMQDTATKQSNPTQTPIKTSTPKPIKTATSTPKPTSTIAPSPTSGLGVGSTKIREQDGMEMVYIPEGSFDMGSTLSESQSQPVHKVYLDAFWIDKLEVTNEQYEKCVLAGTCDLPVKNSSSTRNLYYGNPQYYDFPVINVTWYAARDYCEWAGRQLPTEAQWEKAAQGDLVNRTIFPWGNQSLTSQRANYHNSNLGDTVKVGSYPEGASVYGALDMAGNVYEWVADWYVSDYYHSQQEWVNPQGPSAGTQKVARGGGWAYDEPSLRIAGREGWIPELWDDGFGFRCAASTNQAQNSLLVETTPVTSTLESPSSTRVRQEDGMEQVYIPAGEFYYGGDLISDEGETYLEAYWIDKYEVTNAQYEKCVAAGACGEVRDYGGDFNNTYGDPAYDQYPVTGVYIDYAFDYCRWVGGRLPSDQMWEKAARGEQDKRTYPWGEGLDGTRANYCDSNCVYRFKDYQQSDAYPESSPVGSYPDGASPYGALDMSGNIWEFVSSGNIRGGSWADNLLALVISHWETKSGGVNIGFRCSNEP